MKIYKLLTLGAITSVALTGCMDDKYDLSDIDTTSRFSVENLVLPINIEPILLKDIITVHPEDTENQLKIVTINGETFYAVQQSGDFKSDDIFVEGFTAQPQSMSQAGGIFKLDAGRNLKGRSAANGQEFYLLWEPVQNELNYQASNIDPTIRSLSKIYYEDVHFIIDLDVNLPSGSQGRIDNLEISLPKGLELKDVSAPGYTYKATDYKASTGILTLGQLTLTGGKASVDITSVACDFTDHPDAFKYNPQLNSGELNFVSDFTIKSGTLAVGNVTSAPEEIAVTVNYRLTELNATAVIGEIKYDLEGTGLDIAPIQLNNLPDFLSGPETNLVLANPQIYISLDNPIGQYGLKYQSGLDITTMREDEVSANFPLGTLLEVKPITGSYNFLLAPNPGKVTAIPEGFENPSRITYNNLGSVLAGEGLPNAIDLKLVEPMIPQQMVTKPFQLNSKIDGMVGNYLFLAPLALDGAPDAKTRIVYEDRREDWADEDLDALTINLFKLESTISNDLPLDAVLTVEPLGKDHKPIKDVKVSQVVVAAKAQNVDTTFTIEGEVTGLDGILIRAIVTPEDNSDRVLEPNQYIKLENNRVIVTGNWTKEL